MKKIILFIVFFNCTLLAQMDEFAIRSSDRYFTGIAESNQVTEAKISAKIDLVNNIVSYVKNSLSDEIFENDSVLTKNTRSSSKSISLVKLKNLKYLDVEPVNLKFRVIAYIDKKDYYDAVNDIKNEVRESFKRVEKLEKEEGIIKAAPNYYLTYLKTFYCPEPIRYYSIIEQDSILSLRNYIEEKISKYLSGIELAAKNTRVSDNIEGQFEAGLTANYKGKPVDKINARFDLPDNPNRLINDGSAVLFLYSEPSHLVQKRMVVLSMYAEKNGDIAELDSDFNIQYKKEVALDFSKSASIDFKIEAQGGGLLYFYPEIKHLSVSKVSWDFGDGTRTDEINSKHIYENSGSYQVKMNINSSETLVKSHTINYNSLTNKVTIDTNLNASKSHLEDRKVSDTGNIIISDVIKNLIAKNDFKELVMQMDRYKHDGKIMWGKETDFDNPDNCFVFIIDQNTQKTLAVFDKGSNDRKNLMNDAVCSDIKKTYKGKSAVYVEVY